MVARLRRIKAKIDPARERWQRSLAPNLRHVVGEFHAPSLENIVRAAEHPDAYLARDTTRGLLLVCSVSVSGALLARSTLASIPLEDWCTDPHSRGAKILRRAHPSSNLTLDDA